MICTNSQTWIHFSIACFVAFALTMTGVEVGSAPTYTNSVICVRP